MWVKNSPSDSDGEFLVVVMIAYVFDVVKLQEHKPPAGDGGEMYKQNAVNKLKPCVCRKTDAAF